MIPKSIKLGANLIVLVFLVAIIAKPTFPSVRECVSEAMIAVLTTRAERAVTSGDFERAERGIRHAIKIGSEHLAVNRRLMAAARHCDRDLWETATENVFFHIDSTSADHREILLWSLLHGELVYFDKLVKCLPKGEIAQDWALNAAVEFRAMETSNSLMREKNTLAMNNVR